ncbi:MAG: MBL fold metallo-hydrolase [Ardenticatenaceae bacterium]|nr:MBL fold metallo-hydrolase [Anaerolineales bacterium]MCB8921516.1 MBL fold metallo-hydrolase [Ardenticatenaceae bacterium]MCB8990923.1 MBL fold metallo-hydrolase [Ardenticatenaceae bacterium]
MNKKEKSWAEGVTAVILGTMQDGGLPHIGCRCAHCQAAEAQPQYAACLAIVDGRQTPPGVYLLDATPDIKHQLNLLADVLGPHSTRPNRLRQLDAIFLTHAHMGHIGGLPQLGPEAMAVQDLPVYAAPLLIDLLQEARVWRPMVNGLALRPLHPHQPISLAPNLTITPIPVPHRDEWGVGTFAFHVQGPGKSLLYLPDIDAWTLWAETAVLDTVDYALVDASFWSNDELGGRTAVAHPLVPDTLVRFAHIPGQLVLTHLNHTNPLLNIESVSYMQTCRAGVQIARLGQDFPL